MQLAITADDKVADKILWMLDHFKDDGVEITSMQDYLTNKRYLQKELDRLDGGEARLLSEDEFWEEIDRELESAL